MWMLQLFLGTTLRCICHGSRWHHKSLSFSEWPSAQASHCPSQSLLSPRAVKIALPCSAYLWQPLPLLECCHNETLSAGSREITDTPFPSNRVGSSNAVSAQYNVYGRDALLRRVAPQVNLVICTWASQKYFTLACPSCYAWTHVYKEPWLLPSGM